MSAPDPSSPSAPDSRPTRCEHADRCGGCPIIALPYDEQLALKRGRVVQSLARYTSLELVYTEPVVAAEPFTAYRTRAKLIVAPGGTIGLFAKGGGHHVVDIPRCRVLSPVLSRIAGLLRERVIADEREGGALTPFGSAALGALRAIDLREVRPTDDDDARVLVTLVVQRDRVGDPARFTQAARELMAAAPEIAGVALNFHEGDAPQILGSETAVVAGVASANDRVGASLHLATYGSFVQAHRGQAKRVHAMLAAALGVERARAEGRALRVLDLYGGSGAIGLGLAAAGASVVLVESFAPAVAHVEAAARSASLDIRAICSDVASALRGLVERGEPFDAAVVNPPRRGVSPAARDWIGRLAPATLAYVSCDPDTLARDLDHLGRLGYATTSLRPLDMIPLTDEVESVCILHRTAVPQPRILFEDATVIVVDKGAHEPTLPHDDHAGSLLARVRRIAGAEDAMPAHRIDVGTSGLVVFGRREADVTAWAGALAAPSTRKIYVAAARGVTPSKGAITRDLREDGRLYAARTRYRRLAVASGHSVLRVIPELGLTHQIRRHLAAIGHPVIGDERYGHAPTNRFFEEKNGLDRAFLHCVRIEIDHPVSGQRLVFEAPLPGDLRAVLERTSGPGTLRFLDHKNALGTYGVGGNSSLPPPPDSFHDRGSVLDVDASTPTLRPEITGDDDDAVPSRRS
jgi:23S rRNA (uracil1939-C5)-methyltransferase